MAKNIFVIFYYSYLIYYFNTSGPTAFMMLFSLVSELALILLIFLVFSLLSAKADKKRALNIVAGVLAVVFIQYFIATIISDSIAETVEFKAAFFPMIGALLLIYALNVYGFITKKYPIEIIEKSIVFQVLLITMTGFAGIILLSIFGVNYKAILLTSLAVARIGLEVLLNRKMKRII